MKFTTLLFEQNSYITPQFVSFARNFKKQLNSELKKIGAELVSFSRGHFYLSGFFFKGEKCYYFSWHNGDENLLYRTAKNTKDFTGGSNCWISLEDSFDKMNLN